MKVRGKILFLAGAVTALAAGWSGFPRIIYKTQPQPVDFSHKVHADQAGQKCEDCHGFRDDGSFAGIPSLDKCGSCHAAPMGTTAAEKNFIGRYVTPQREPEWRSYSRQPENVYFSHAIHVRTAKLACERCHGAIGASEKLPVYGEDRISGYSRDIWGTAKTPGMTMNDCIACHKAKGVSRRKTEAGTSHSEAAGTDLSCLDCHK
jgi:hypothetical protein